MSIKESLREIRAASADMAELARLETPPVRAAFAEVPSDVWRLMVAAVRWPDDEQRLLGMLADRWGARKVNRCQR